MDRGTLGLLINIKPLNMYEGSNCKVHVTEPDAQLKKVIAISK